MHRFFVKNDIPNSGIFILENEAISHQLLRVLKIKKGEKVMFFNGSGFDFLTKIDKLSGRFVFGKIMEKIKNIKDPETEVHLYQSLIKKDKFEWVLEKCTELGVKFFHPLISENSVKTGLNMERAHRIVQEATEQSGQNKTPKIKEVMKFNQAIEEIDRNTVNLLFDRNRDTKVNSWKLQGMALVNIFIGPEGGFSEKELNWAGEHDFVFASLGPRILRSETAAVASSALVLTSEFK